MRQTIMFMLVLAVLIGACQAHDADALTLAANDKAAATIVLARDATVPEQTAAAELAHYLGQITGSEFVVRRESETPEGGSHIYVGVRTVSSAPQDKLAPDEWVVRSVGNDLFIIGGSPRGTLYGAYHFLEDVCGVHWWNPWEESVPQRKTLKVGNINLHGKPVIRYGDIHMLLDDGVSKRFTLNKGPNIVRCAVINSPGVSEFCARFFDAEDKPVQGFTLSVVDIWK